MRRLKAAMTALLLIAGSASAQYREYHFTVYTPLHVTWYTCSHLTYSGTSGFGYASAKCQDFHRNFSTEAIFQSDFEVKYPKGGWKYKLHWWDAEEEEETIIERGDCAALMFTSYSLVLSCND